MQTSKRLDLVASCALQPLAFLAPRPAYHAARLALFARLAPRTHNVALFRPPRPSRRAILPRFPQPAPNASPRGRRARRRATTLAASRAPTGMTAGNATARRHFAPCAERRRMPASSDLGRPRTDPQRPAHSFNFASAWPARGDGHACPPQPTSLRHPHATQPLPIGWHGPRSSSLVSPASVGAA